MLTETAGVPQLQPGSVVRYSLPQAWLGTLSADDERFVHAQAQLHSCTAAQLQSARVWLATHYPATRISPHPHTPPYLLRPLHRATPPYRATLPY